MNAFGCHCPKCGSSGQIDICAQVWVRLTRVGTAADLSRQGNHEWNDASRATCDCGWTGRVNELIKESGNG
ncbi:hypothetical protein [Magnetospirillum molischianum]|uniref:hypothetical protein n=1 Tax=Magnetospirillum molischianum TaxID=1083 RepID=UPI0003055AC8|nr:hypothetical protein [Magnetospirillum molischianum]